MEVVKVSTKGQVVIPKEIREALGIRNGDYLVVTEKNGYIVMKKLSVEDVFREGEELAKALEITEKDVIRAVREVRYEDST
ncbi:AbrB/MazE/SpoVT family DNA-binding domain-containing protein [Thermococcus sp. MV11]|uniref:AbrB/MazE/SpoVT family DNA-binding domain-containing protein n=1 Tax=Thermococcus sp. MV11 TaxID=1638267 RepID=UPI001431EC4F|nr:AbrB/MazE/SpoVT family DNA-binding domain-containing protein [Thermococcus sp. MV11]NJE03164.1 AbrB/MazE/SpoVT family DNA-binding domain-containing protein [Thermococcus sp. MV11]